MRRSPWPPRLSVAFLSAPALFICHVALANLAARPDAATEGTAIANGSNESIPNETFPGDVTPAEEVPTDPNATAADPADSTNSLEEVLVTGEQPGPGLWKVTHGTHVLYLFGTISPLPKGVQWRSREVEEVIAKSKVILFGANVTPRIGIFRAIRLFPSVLRARFNPDKAMLKDIVTPERYERWLPYKETYFKKNDEIERVRPMFIAMQISGAALAKNGLNAETSPDKVIAATARKHKVPMRAADIKVDLGDPKKAIEDFTETPREADLDCFNQTLDHFESDLEAMRLRANAWAVGDVEALRSLPRPVAQPVCIKAMMSAPGLQDEFARLQDQLRDTWLTHVEQALAANDVSLVVMGIDDILRPDGNIAHLKARGYTVEEP
jgi:uncharacterized protein YbaP (TraB family)